MTGRDAVRWSVATLPLAPIAAGVYLAFEWLFVVTKPSPTASLPLAEQVAVLARSPLPLLWPLLAVQAAASVLSAIAFPRLRGLALVPAAVITGLMLLMLTDNFTYTLFGFGVLTSSAAVRVAYAALLSGFIVVAGWKLQAAASALCGKRGAGTFAVAILLLLAAAPAADWREPQLSQDLSEPPSQGRLDPPASALPNILFLGVDGIDASFLSAYGYERPTTPFLESLRDETLFFENAFSNATRTHGSIVTLLTGRLPFTTRVTFPPTALQGEDSRRNLPALLKERGYRTLQLGMRHYADAEDVNLFGFDAANYRWQRLEDVDAGGSSPRDPTDVFRAAVEERLDERIGHLFGFRNVANGFAHVEGREQSPLWRDERRVQTLTRYFRDAPEPWFVHLHLLDTHCCRYYPNQIHFAGDGREQAWVVRDSQVLETDRHIRRLFEALAAHGRLDRTIVVINSDHGAMWKATERVPLMMRFPGGTPRGRVPANVQLADVAPTMLAYLGMPIPAWMDGVSLLRPDRIPASRPIFGLSDVERREGASGARLLVESGPPNYGAAAAMVVLGRRWFELRLKDGALNSGPVAGHTGAPGLAVSDEAARRLLSDYLAEAGFRVGPGGL
jgi:arylsulfatase A-like enzyme